MSSVTSLFDSLWQDYIQRLCPSAAKIHLLLEQGAPLVNDHIALRTVNHPQMGLARMAAPFIAIGYAAKGEYWFTAKKLYARHYEHPDPMAPKVFISELLIEQCSVALQKTVDMMTEQLDSGCFNNADFLAAGRLWQMDTASYFQLANESEYAGWVAAHGFGANHFTVNVNGLNGLDNVVAVNALLRQAGFSLNDSGGEVKGSPDVYLEQSSTMADKVAVTFSDKTLQLPGGFYEFAKRYPLADGQLYQGFVTASADKIFESTGK